MSQSLVAHAGIESQVGPDLRAGVFGDALRDFAFRIVQIAENHGVVSRPGAGIDAGGLLVAVDGVEAQRGGVDEALAAWHVRVLRGDLLEHDRARLVWAGHHAIAAADADVAVDQHDAVGAFERGAGGADVDAGRVLAMLAHHRRRMHAAAAHVLQLDLAYPLWVGARMPGALDAVFGGAGFDAIVATGSALVGVDQQAPADLPRHRLLGRARSGDLDQADSRREHPPAKSGCRNREKAAPAQGLVRFFAHGFAPVATF